ncbi:hypothetical protein PIB30_039598 [Stylosanthes scabra]|uniref:Transposase-associated domain-containing protein n=1 Tax=Stylosanthes scabra TaxID=79078 RepID=A0ABU6YDC5_9FABA|nr:hypothetical protein [Stylosanthes scabra]
MGEGGLVAPSRKPLFAGKYWSYKGLCTRMVLQRSGGIKPEFMNEVDGFVAYVFNLEEFRVAGVSRCPCSKCRLLNWIGTEFTGPVDFSLHHSADPATQSLESQGHMLQQQIDEVKTLRDTLAQRDKWTEEHLRRMEEMQRQMAAFYNPLRPGVSATTGGSSTSTAPHLPPRPPLPPPPPPPRLQPDHDDDGDDENYEDA